MPAAKLAILFHRRFGRATLGNAAYTQDVDLTLLTGLGAEAAYVDPVLEHFPGRLRDARKFALEHRVLLVRSSAGIDIDMALGAFPFEEQTVDRATLWEMAPSVGITTCSAEDLVIHKVFAGRDRDCARRQRSLLRYHRTAQKFCPDDHIQTYGLPGGKPLRKSLVFRCSGGASLQSENWCRDGSLRAERLSLSRGIGGPLLGAGRRKIQAFLQRTERIKPTPRVGRIGDQHDNLRLRPLPKLR
ncbi:MAG TPA: hypothetical protein VHQ47_12800 [Phycisphaerae bacterium]|nr:hypothetical protein [Phycisphaerae bacterium]